MSIELYYSKLILVYGMFTETKLVKVDLLLKGLNSKQFIIRKDFKYIFGDIESGTLEGRTFIFGRLIKYADREEEAMDEEKQKIVDELHEDKVIAKSHFIIDLAENIVLNTEVANQISNLLFISVFMQLLSMGLRDENIEVEIYPITDQYNFLERLRSFSKVESLRLTIYPTNPFPSKEIEEVDALLKQQKVKKKIVIYKAGKDGLNIEQDEIKKETLYADIGYGQAIGVGQNKDGSIRKIYSNKANKQRKTPQLPFETGIAGLFKDINNLLSENDKKG